jgi:hypothetical protein
VTEQSERHHRQLQEELMEAHHKNNDLTVQVTGLPQMYDVLAQVNVVPPTGNKAKE